MQITSILPDNRYHPLQFKADLIQISESDYKKANIIPMIQIRFVKKKIAVFGKLPCQADMGLRFDSLTGSIGMLIVSGHCIVESIQKCIRPCDFQQ